MRKPTQQECLQIIDAAIILCECMNADYDELADVLSRMSDTIPFVLESRGERLDRLLFAIRVSLGDAKKTSGTEQARDYFDTGHLTSLLEAIKDRIPQDLNMSEIETPVGSKDETQKQ